MRISEPVAEATTPQNEPTGYQPPEIPTEPIPVTESKHREFVLQPLGFGQLFDVAIKLFTRHFKMFVVLEVVTVLPVAFIFAILFGVGMIAGFNMPKPSMNMIFLMVPLFIIAFFAMFLVIGLLQGATTKLVSDIYLGEPYSVKRSLSASYKKMFRFFLFLICAMILSIIGMVMLIIPMIYLTIAFMLGAPIIMLETGGVSQTIDRCFKLIRGFWFRFAFAMLVCSVGTNIFYYAISMPFMMLTRVVHGKYVIDIMMVAQAVSGGIAMLIVYPIPMILVVLFYYDIRVRKEGFDLEMLAREIA